MWPDFSQWTAQGTSAANTQQTVTEAAAANQSHYVTGFHVSVRAADNTANDLLIQLKDGSTVKGTWVLGPNARRGDCLQVTLPRPLQITNGNDAVLVVGAGATGLITEAVMFGFTR